MSSHFFVKLPNRGTVVIRGEDRHAFLQGLITNDITKLQRRPCVYSCLLTPQGKFHHDFFITEQSNAIFLECEGLGRARNLAETLTKFKLRSKVDIECIDDVQVYAGLGDLPDGGMVDPRMAAMGWRSYKAPPGTPEKFNDWDRHRINLCVPDGSRDLIPDRSLPLENNLEHLNAISFTKGCFMGQELIARMYHRALAKKHLHCIERESDSVPLPATGDTIAINGAVVGEMRSVCGLVGLALLRDDSLEKLTDAGLAIKSGIAP